MSLRRESYGIFRQHVTEGGDSETGDNTNQPLMQRQTSVNAVTIN